MGDGGIDNCTRINRLMVCYLEICKVHIVRDRVWSKENKSMINKEDNNTANAESFYKSLFKNQKY